LITLLMCPRWITSSKHNGDWIDAIRWTGWISY
jgi:hypothetical protein